MRKWFSVALGFFFVLTMVGASVAGAATKTITVGTSGPGSVAYLWVSTLGTVLDRFDSPVRIKVAGGVFDVEAMRIMQRGAKGVDASLVTGSTLGKGIFNKPPFKKDEKFDKLKAVFPLGLSPLQIVARADSGIKSLEDMAGKRISAGARGGGPDLFSRDFFATVLPDMKVEIVPMAFSAVSSAMQDRKIDAYLTFGAAPYPAIVETISLVKVNFISVSEEIRTKWFKLHPEHHTMAVKAGSYDGQTEDMVTLGHVAGLLTSDQLDEETVYQLTKLLLNPEFKAALIKDTITWAPAYEGLDNKVYFEDLKALGMKFHPGAAKAFNEAGYTAEVESVQK